MASDNVISFENSAAGARQRLADGRLQKLVAAMRAQAADTLPQLVQDLFEHLDDALYELADKSASDALETRYFEAMRELRKLREPIANGFVGDCLNGFDRFWEGGSLLTPATDSDDALAEDELSLVADEDLEEDLAITSMVSKAENRFHRELFALNMRFGALRGGDVADSENPVGPSRVAENFAEALQQWQGDTAVRLLVFKLFDRYVMAFVGGLYDEINDTLVSAEVLPRIVQRARRNPVAPSVQRARDPHQTTEQAEQGEGNQELLGLLGQLLAAQRQVADSDASPALRPNFSLTNAVAGHLPEISTETLVQALSGLQLNALHRAPVDVDEAQALQLDLAQSLGQALEMGSAEHPLKRLGRADQDVFDVVGLLFDFILDDTNLPEAMKALLGRLQIPMLKVAVSDRGFFSDRQHPARALLNNLARAAVAWSDDGDRSENSAYGHIETAVNQVLSEYADDVSVFEQVNEQFVAYLERERRSAEVAEERVGQVKRGQEQLEVARQRVREVIDGYVDACEPPDCQVPDAVLGMLNEGWSDVLLLAYLREGEQSENWKNACKVVEELLWSVQPKAAQPERQALLKAIPDLLKRVRQGLVNISFDQHRSALLFKELQACHIAALRGARVEPTSGEAPTEAPAVGIVEAVTESTVDDEYARQAAELRVGQWMEWQLDESHWQRGKLSWRSEVSDSFIFVSRKGVKLAELKKAEIAAWLRESRARVLADVDKPLMDRALDAMVQALQKTAQPVT